MRHPFSECTPNTTLSVCAVYFLAYLQWKLSLRQLNQNFIHVVRTRRKFAMGSTRLYFFLFRNTYWPWAELGAILFLAMSLTRRKKKTLIGHELNSAQYIFFSLPLITRLIRSYWPWALLGAIFYYTSKTLEYKSNSPSKVFWQHFQHELRHERHSITKKKQNKTKSQSTFRKNMLQFTLFSNLLCQ